MNYGGTGTPLGGAHHHSQDPIFGTAPYNPYNPALNGGGGDAAYNPNPIHHFGSTSNGNLAKGASRGSHTSLNRTPSHANRASGGHNLNRTPSRAGSTLSKSQSLIKKNIEVQDLKPADLLIERFVAWKAIVKQLCMYFEGIADIENNTAKEMSKLAGVIQVPFKSGNQFLGQGGLQDVYYAIRDKTRTIADQHANLGRTIESSIVQHLQKLLVEIKAHIKNIQNNTGKLAASVTKERELSTRLVGSLANSISIYKNTPTALPARLDPYIANALVAHQLTRQVLEENLLQKSLVIMQGNSGVFEEGIVRSVQGAWAAYASWAGRARGERGEVEEALRRMVEALEPQEEWIAFAAREDHLVDPETPLRDVEAIRYPLKNDPSVFPIHVGYLERKATSAFSRSWREGYYVLTPAGYLHEYASEEAAGGGGAGAGHEVGLPIFSVFLPSCTLGPPTAPGAARHGFSIEGRKDGMGVGGAGGLSGGKTGGLGAKGGLKALFSGTSLTGSSGLQAPSTSPFTTSSKPSASASTKAWHFRARSHEAKMEWWNDVRMLCARYLVASEVVKRSGPVENAVRGVGYGEEELVGVYEGEGEGVGVFEGEEGYVYGGAQAGYRYEREEAYAGEEGYAHEEAYEGEVGRGDEGYEGEPLEVYEGEEQKVGYYEGGDQTQSRYRRSAGDRKVAQGQGQRYHETEEGSSVEEEEEHEREEPPVYSGGGRYIGGVGPNGYLIDKKPNSAYDDRYAPAPVPIDGYPRGAVPEYGEHEWGYPGHRQEGAKQQGYHGAPQGYQGGPHQQQQGYSNGRDRGVQLQDRGAQQQQPQPVKRKGSKRQMEKAPEVTTVDDREGEGGEEEGCEEVRGGESGNEPRTGVEGSQEEGGAAAAAGNVSPTLGKKGNGKGGREAAIGEGTEKLGDDVD